MIFFQNKKNRKYKLLISPKLSSKSLWPSKTRQFLRILSTKKASRASLTQSSVRSLKSKVLVRPKTTANCSQISVNKLLPSKQTFLKCTQLYKNIRMKLSERQIIQRFFSSSKFQISLRLLIIKLTIQNLKVHKN